jgi:hypothetical protein
MVWLDTIVVAWGKTRVTLANIGGNIGKRKPSRWPGEEMKGGRYRVTMDEVRQSETNMF